jgi:ribokinase
LVEPGGVRRLLYTRGANARRELVDEDLAYVLNAEWLYIADPLPTVVETLGKWYRAGWSLPRLALDPGSVGATRGAEFFAPIFPHLSALFLNEGEARELSGREEFREALELLREACPLVVVKRGERGALVVTREVDFASPAFPVRAADTTGCGDAFNAAFLFCLVRGKSLWEAARWGNAAGALVAQRLGAHAPTREELEGFLARNEGVR